MSDSMLPPPHIWGAADKPRLVTCIMRALKIEVSTGISPLFRRDGTSRLVEWRTVMRRADGHGATNHMHSMRDRQDGVQPTCRSARASGAVA